MARPALSLRESNLRIQVLLRIFVLVASVGLTQAAYAQTVSTTTYGTPGLIDMPTAQSAPDAELSMSVFYFAGNLRTTLSFQITPRLSGSFRYSSIERLGARGALFDRSFDLRYRLIDEGKYLPAVAVGLQDFIGTGIYSGEYFVASKRLTPTVAVSGGLGWGRLGSFNGFSNPLGVLGNSFGSRSRRFSGQGGVVDTTSWFRGDAAFFGGIVWQVTPKLTLKAEYSSDAYTRETAANNFTRKTPYNLGLDYQVNENINLHATYMYGSEFGAGITFKLNPKEPVIIGGQGKAPQPVRVRLPDNINNLGWTTIPNAQKNLRKATQVLLAKEGLALEAMSISSSTVTLRLRNERYLASAEAIGRTARILTRVMPDSVETFKIIPIARGIPLSEITLKRSDLEVLEHDGNGAALSYAAAKITDAANSSKELIFREDLYPKFTWGIGPYIRSSYFDPDSPIRAEVGVKASASYTITPGLVLSGEISKRAVGNIHTATRRSDSTIRRVRSDGALYNQAGDPAINDLTLSYHFRPGKNLYGRVTVGYLETMYGGVSTELLWKPVDSRLAIGLEANLLRQRDFNQLFGFQDYQVATGHLTAYWDMGKGFHSQLSVGRYLGGDLGGTLKLERTFKNGWRVGAYATITDIPFSDFGEGSFDKGLLFTVPLDHFVGSPTGRTFDSIIQPLSRDGGARVNVDGRLYGTVQNHHDKALKDSWGRFWR